ncbi:hypothetical protein F0562_032287 [Nyssa sinensis]|uniref:AB hydrolase-1 domain-containing protein n=1 Tax=Nyssa sinensis TaxID=561372 RepID=A0A5J5APM1_9ASTE|nr:hypothetical protein F0562_032287 [Nyssa sinensis]
MRASSRSSRATGTRGSKKRAKEKGPQVEVKTCMWKLRGCWSPSSGYGALDLCQVTDELVQIILLPGLEPGAADVFLDFICYSEGPFPKELLPQVKCPVLVAWANKDPWEPIELRRAYGNFDSVEDFVVLSNVGHCPHDEAPHLVNPLVESFVARYATPKASFPTKAI